MPKKFAINMHLFYTKPNNGVHIFSGFAAALRDAREATGRKPANGVKTNQDKIGSWLGAIGYLCLLDQIGSCFRPSNANRVNGNSIKKALKYFTDLSEKEINAIYALRCAFAHDFSLYNINHRKPELTHQFAVGIGGSMTTVILPKEQWDGDYSNRTPENKTIINLEALGDLIEGVCVKLFNLAKQDELEIELEGGSDELLNRYGVYKKQNKS